eukprot:CAMPEP_0115854310 /NCGR_PEP_ID=MMETSP0287-20121206/13961_1 /TAXON_ID=412157 /ORGANISM="Chrysochromulina rotalis, Strain UIO044" /LENGTH=323 /DNA_ID=CAMNT_0003308429 /DNA_START=37 /DNA_END=1011 /DNA_ORIENTATION=+
MTLMVPVVSTLLIGLPFTPPLRWQRQPIMRNEVVSRARLVRSSISARPPLHKAVGAGCLLTARYHLPILFMTDHIISPFVDALPPAFVLRTLELSALACEPLAPLSLIVPPVAGFVSLAALFAMLLPMRLLIGMSVARSSWPTIDMANTRFQDFLQAMSVHWVGPLAEELVDRALLQGIVFQRGIVDRFGRSDAELRRRLWAFARVACALHFGCGHAVAYTALLRNNVPRIPSPTNVLSQCGLATLASFFVYSPSYRQYGLAGSLAAHILWNALAALYVLPVFRLLTLLLSPLVLLIFLSDARSERLETTSDASMIVRWAGQR